MMKHEVTAIMNRPQGLVPASISEATTMADHLAKSALVPKEFRGRPADVFLAITYGIELGLPPVTVLNSISVIQGRPTLYAASMVGLCWASGLCEKFVCVERSATKVTYMTKRKGNPEQSMSFTIEEAKDANLLRNENYKKYPARMLEARCKAFLAKDVYPDVLRGMISSEEAQDLEPAIATHVEAFEAPEPVAAPEPVGALSEALPSRYFDGEEQRIVDVALAQPILTPADMIRATQTREEQMTLLKGLKELDKGSQEYRDAIEAWGVKTAEFKA